MTTPTFHWPDGTNCGVSLSFDDGRTSTIDVGVPLLDSFDVKATFYIVPDRVESRLSAWRAAAEAGHEMGNHTLTHPCSGNFSFIRRKGNPLEEYTLERMERELTGANEAIENLFGIRPRTFAYPCTQTYVGRGAQRKSYVPLVAKHFEIGRTGLDESAAEPGCCDLAAVPSLMFDRVSWSHIQQKIDHSRDEGTWLILTGHDVAEDRRQAASPAMLEALCAYCTDPANGIWLDTVANIGAYVQEQQRAST